VSSIHFSSSNTSRMNLFLTSSVDWSVKLWSASLPLQQLMEFWNPIYDYICDVKWSPTNCSIFFTVSANGHLCFWNLGKSSTQPVEVLRIGKDQNDLMKNAALNKGFWADDSSFVFLGDSFGAVHTVQVHTSVFSNQNDGSKFLSLLSRSDGVIQE
jgi:dynein intermediate chain